LAGGAVVALCAVVGMTLLLQAAQHLVPVYGAARDLPAGTTLAAGDLTQLRVKLPAAALRQYLRPEGGRSYVGQVLTAGIRKNMLLPATMVAPSAADLDLVESPIPVNPGDLPEGLRPGDHVQVWAAYTQGPHQGTAQVLLTQAEVVRLLSDTTSGLGASGRSAGIQVRMPADRAQTVAAAIATSRIWVIKTQPGGGDGLPATQATTTTAVGP